MPAAPGISWWGAWLGLPGRGGQVLVDSPWLTPSTSCPQGWQLSGANPWLWAEPLCPQGKGPRIALTHPPATSKGAHRSQRCLLSQKVPAVPEGALHPTR